MDAEAVRAEFRSFVGESRYRRFVRAVNTIDRRLGRMRYWQEADWTRFTRTRPGCAMSFGAILEAFRVCEVHGGELVDGPTPVWYGHSFRDEFIKERLASFPWAMILGDRDDDWFRRGDPVLYCRECREAARPWYRMRAVAMPPSFTQRSVWSMTGAVPAGSSGVESAIPFDRSAAELAGRIAGDWERVGRTIGTTDTRVAAIAVKHGLELATGNTTHFRYVQNLGYPLTLVNW